MESKNLYIIYRVDWDWLKGKKLDAKSGKELVKIKSVHLTEEEVVTETEWLNKHTSMRSVYYWQLLTQE